MMLSITYTMSLYVGWVSWKQKLRCVIKFLEPNIADIPVMIQEAPGLVSVTADGWTVDTTKAAFLGVTAHWIEVKEGKWMVRAEVVGFRSISGDHSGENLGRYLVGVFDRVGIMSKNHSKVHDDDIQFNL